MMKTGLKPGDSVTLRKGLEIGKRYQDVILVKNMIFDSVSVISASDEDDSTLYRTKGLPFCYSRYMLKKVK